MTLNNEERLDDFLDKGTDIRKTAASLLKDVYSFENSGLSLWSQQRKDQRIRGFEGRFEELYNLFFRYDDEANAFISKLIKARGPIVDRQITDMYVSQLSSRIDSLRSLIRDVSSAINGRRSEINNAKATVIAISAFSVSVVFGFGSLIISLMNLYASAEPIILWLPKTQ